MRDSVRDSCEKRGVSLIGVPIPEAYREMYGGKTHSRREIRVYSRELDRIVARRCPDCGYEWQRERAARDDD